MKFLSRRSILKSLGLLTGVGSLVTLFNNCSPFKVTDKFGGAVDLSSGSGSDSGAIPGTPATKVLINGPGAGSVNHMSSPFSVSLDGTIENDVVIFFDDGGMGGVFNPTSVTLSKAAVAATFQYKAASSGVKQISVSNVAGLANPSPKLFSALVVAWPTSIAVGNWAPIPTSNTLASLDPDNDPQVNPNFPAMAPWRSSGSHAAIVSAWCGAVPMGGMVGWYNPGGHNDGYPAASYALKLDTTVPYYERLCKPSGAVGRAPLNYASEFSRGIYQIDLTGRHRAQHTLNFQIYWPGVGVATLSGILLANTGGGAANVKPYVSHPATGEIIGGLGAEIPTVNVGNGSYAAACYDSLRHVGWHHSSGYYSKFSKWGGPANDVWTDVGTDCYFQGAISMAYCPPLDLILVGNGGNDGVGTGPLNQNIPGGWGIFDPANGQSYIQGQSATFPTFTGAPDLNSEWATGLSPGLCQPQWAASLGAFLAWDNSASHTTKVMRITPPAAGDPRTGTWIVDYLPVAPANATVPSAAQANGTFGRFFVWDEAGICGVINSVNETGYFFRYA